MGKWGALRRERRRKGSGTFQPSRSSSPLWVSATAPQGRDGVSQSRTDCAIRSTAKFRHVLRQSLHLERVVGL